MASYAELRRHTDSDGDELTADGVRAALDIGRGLSGGYALLVSSGAQRATQTLACFARMLREPVGGGAVVETGLRSRVEDRWRAAYQRAPAAASWPRCVRPIRSLPPGLDSSSAMRAGPVGSRQLLADGVPANRVDGRRFSDAQIAHALALVEAGASLTAAGAAVGATRTAVLRWRRKAA
jgi:hypothetical protein